MIKCTTLYKRGKQKSISERMLMLNLEADWKGTQCGFLL